MNDTVRGNGPIISASGLSKRYHEIGGDLEVFSDIDFTLARGCLLYTSPSPRD